MRTATILAFVAAVALLAGSIGIGLRDRSAKRAAVDQALTNKAGDGVAQLDEYFARARSINLITAHNPSFREFYARPGSRIAKVRARGPAIRGAENGLATSRSFTRRASARCASSTGTVPRTHVS